MNSYARIVLTPTSDNLSIAVSPIQYFFNTADESTSVKRR